MKEKDNNTEAKVDNSNVLNNSNNNYDSFHNAFNDPITYDVNFYLEQVKQKNEVEFNEDGAIVRSLTMADMEGCTSAEPLNNVLDVKLNQPFIYIIRDCNYVPILVGHIDNPVY